jgi:hypothetical protein
MPSRQAGQTTISGIVLPRLAVAAGARALPLLLAFLGTAAAPDPVDN